MNRGLSEQEALHKLEDFGPNELRDKTLRSMPQIILQALSEPMVLLLLAIAGVYLFLNQIEEIFSLSAFLLLILGITIVQESRTEKTLAALKQLSSPRALVIRDGRKKRIPGREVVVGDLVLLNEGDRIPADIELLPGTPISVDESLLTGESFPVEKSAPEKVYSSTLVVRGNAIGTVVGTGLNTEIGRIGKSLADEKLSPTPLQRQTRGAVRKLSIVASALTAFIVFFYGITHHSWAEAILVGLTLAMAILPNELPAVLLIFLATGAGRVSKWKVLTRRIPAIESLGAITYLCVDKTGTLTENRMAVRSFWFQEKEIEIQNSQGQELPEIFHEVLEFGILASRLDPTDPMEKAISESGKELLSNTEHLHPNWPLTKEYPLTPELLAVSYAWHPKSEGMYQVAAKGSPEAIINLCHLSPDEAARIMRQVEIMAARGQRIIGVARAMSKNLPQIQHDLNFEFRGLIGLVDPVRSDVRAAIEECQSAGIKVLIMTGDHPATAKSVAKEIGLGNPEETITGPELSSLTDDEIRRKLKTTQILCRMSPLLKHRIVSILKSMNETVGMTGDGVNDAPALKKADVGIAMGERGTDVAREAASIVLLKDNFSSIVASIKTGRRTYFNLQQAFSYLLTVHVPITIVSVFPVIFKMPLVLLPVHIAFLHLIIEPVSTVYFEQQKAPTDLMRRPPRKNNTPLISQSEILLCLLEGIWMSVIVSGVFMFAYTKNLPSTDLRGLSFTTLVLCNLAFIYTKAFSYPGKRKTIILLLFVTIGLLMSLILYIPGLARLFRLNPLHPVDFAICILAVLIWFLGKIMIAWFSKQGMKLWKLS